MSETIDHALIPELVGLKPLAKLLEKTKKTNSGLEVEIAEKLLFTEMVIETRRTMYEEGNPTIKPPITVGNTSLEPAINCTDYARTTIELCRLIGRESYAMFCAGHASAIVSSKTKPSFWQVDGYYGARAEMNKVLSPDANTAEVVAVQNAVENMDDHSGAYIFWDAVTEAWDLKFFDAEAIRDAAPPQDRIANYFVSQSTIVIAAAPLAHRMLHAIDRIAVLNEVRRENEDFIPEYVSAKETLKSLYPKYC